MNIGDLARAGRTASRMLVLALALGVLLGAVPAHAYYGKGAANYADAWALKRNSNYPTFSADCANFVSQALHSGGGYPYHSKGSTSSTAWWCAWTSTWYGGYFSCSHSWSVANDLRNFLLLDYPGGWDWGRQPTNTPHNDALYGDVLFYDWQSDGYYDHAAIEAAYSATDPKATYYTGNVVDQHTSDRYHAMWDLWAYNSNRWTTTVDLIHIDANN